MSETFKYLVLK